MYRPVDPLSDGGLAPGAGDLEWGLGVCAICLEDGGGPAPCACKGTAGTVHPACLDRWRRQFAPADQQYQQCMQCHARYTADPPAAPPAEPPTEPPAEPGTGCCEAGPHRPQHLVMTMVWMLAVSYGLWVAGGLLEDLTGRCPSSRACRVSWVGVVAAALQVVVGAMPRYRACPIEWRWVAQLACLVATGLTLLATTDDDGAWAALVNGAAVVVAARV